MQQDDPGDSVLCLPVPKHHADQFDVVLIVADAIRSRVLGASTYDAEFAAEDAVERLTRAGYEVRKSDRR